jgi:hypothetical protein
VRLLFVINTEGQAHTWHYIIEDLLAKGHTVKILARDYGHTISLLKAFGLRHDSFEPKGTRMTRFLRSWEHLQICFRLSRRFEPEIVIGFGVDAAITALRLKKPCIVFTDTEGLPVQRYLYGLFANTIITPSCFRDDLGKKQLRVEGYKELAYLHPNHFKPNPSIFEELGLDLNEKYVIIRINSFDAVHDVGRHGFSTANQNELVKELGEYARVFVSQEGSLSEDREAYRLPITPDRIHDALYYSQLLVADTQTMITEAAILGTPAVRSNNFVGPKDMGVFIELEQKYDMIYSFRKPDQAIRKAIELIKQPDLKERWAKKQGRLLADKIDVAQYMEHLIENYPETLKKMPPRKKS